MTILGFSGSLTERESNLDRIVRAILEGSGRETELVKLSRLNYSGCRGCAARCAGKELCPIDDDLKPYFPKIKEAEALVVGTTVYFGGINSFTLAFLERLYAFRHITLTLQGDAYEGKPEAVSRKVKDGKRLTAHTVEDVQKFCQSLV